MKMHLQKTRIQGGKKVIYSIPECGKKGSSNAFLAIVSKEQFLTLDKNNCCINCLASLK
jgi:hypothetical protein